MQPTRRSFTDAELLSWMLQFENSFAERKTFSDVKGWQKTIVAFANSCQYEDAGVLFIGVDNEGNIQKMSQDQNLEELQKSLHRTIKDQIFPQVSIDSRTLVKAQRECLVAIVPGSPKRPHFVGKAYIRIGPESTKEVSEEEYAEMFRQRDSKVYRILRWKGMQVTVETIYSGRDSTYFYEPVIVDCDQEAVTLKVGDSLSSLPLSRIDLAKDFQKGGRLKLLNNQR